MPTRKTGPRGPASAAPAAGAAGGGVRPPVDIPPHLLASNAEWATYAARERLGRGFSLFELAALLHRCSVRAVFDDAWDASRALDPEGDWQAQERPALLLARIQARPHWLLPAPVADTLLALVRATGRQINAELTGPDARAAAEALALEWPPDLATPSTPVAESPERRRARRLARLREIGGDMRKAGKSSWQLIGRRGALADLVREEQAAGRRMAQRQDVSRDLQTAMDEQLQA